MVIGFASGDIPRLPTNLALLKEARIVGVWFGTWAETHRDEFAGNAREMESMVGAGQLRPTHSEAFALENFADALVISPRP